MGFFSSIWKGVKNVFSGIMKVFSPILKPLAKILNTGWGKALMLAVSVFTFGAALMAGGAGFSSSLAAGDGFMKAFVSGGKEFMGTLLGTAGGGKEATSAAGAAAEQGGALMEGAVSTAADPLAMNAAAGAGAGAGEAAAGGLLEGAKSGVGLPSPVLQTGGHGLPQGMGAMQSGTSGGLLGNVKGSTDFGLNTMKAGTPEGLLGAAGKLPPSTDGGWLSKAAGKAWDFVKSDSGQNLIGGALEGYAQGERDDAYYKHQQRYDRMWRDPKQTDPLNEFGDPETPARWNRDPHELSQSRQRTYTPSVPFSTPARSR